MGWQQGSFKLLIVNAGTGYSGLFIYSPAPGPGNLIGSWAASAGTDPYGNAYPQGLSSEVGNLSGQSIIASVFQGVNLRIDQHGLFMYEQVSLPVPPAPPPIPYFVTGTAVAAGSNPVTILVQNPTSAGDTLAVSANAAFGTSTVVSATDSQGNTYQIKVADNTQIPVTMLIADNTNNALGTKALSTADTISVTYSGFTGAKCVSVCGVSSLNANPEDQLVNADGNSISPTVTSAALAQASEVCLSALASSNSGGVPSFSAGWTQIDRQQLGSGQYLTVAWLEPPNASPVTASATLSVSGRWGLLLATLKE